VSCSKSSVFQFIDYLHALPVITGVATIKPYVPTRLNSVRHRTDPNPARLSNKPDHTLQRRPGEKDACPTFETTTRQSALRAAARARIASIALA
jgi:hypothetical protein